MVNSIKVSVDLTAEDIERGVPMNCRECPVARAIARALSALDCLTYVGVTWVSMKGIDVRLEVAGEDMVSNFWSPCTVDAWIEKYDEALTRPRCEPFRFDLELRRYE